MKKFWNISLGLVLLLGLSAGASAQRNDPKDRPPKDPAPKIEPKDPKDKPPRDNRPKDDRPKKPGNYFSFGWRDENGSAA